MATLLGATVAAGTGGTRPELKLNVTANPLVPCGAEAGDTLAMPLVTVVWPNADPAAAQARSKIPVVAFKIG
jgi:hypothetical protein